MLYTIFSYFDWKILEQLTPTVGFVSTNFSCFPYVSINAVLPVPVFPKQTILKWLKLFKDENSSWIIVVFQLKK